MVCDMAHSVVLGSPLQGPPARSVENCLWADQGHDGPRTLLAVTTPTPARRPGVTVPVQLRFADLDPLGHVNNVAFFTLMETARVQFMHEFGGTLRGHVLVARSECDHRREIPASTRVVEVSVQVESVGRTSFLLRHDLSDAGVEVGAGRVVLVAVDEQRRPRPVTDLERAQLLGS